MMHETCTDALHGCIASTDAMRLCDAPMHVRTNGLTDADTSKTEMGSLVSNARTDQIYLVRWADEGFVKIGTSCDVKRWRGFVKRGARLLGLATLPRIDKGMDSGTAEYLLHLALPRVLAPAFGHRSEAVEFLGQRGAGWTECYVDKGSLSLSMFVECVSVTRAGDWDSYWNLRNRWEFQ